MDPSVFIYELDLNDKPERDRDDPDKRHFKQITDEGSWATESRRLLASDSIDDRTRDYFHEQWIVAGHHIRAQIGDDSSLRALLEHILPKYDGPGLHLFRGENLRRWREGVVGFCWTTKRDVAAMFARGLNAFHGGGILLACKVHPTWIISGIHRHSDYLDEDQYTVDPAKISGIEAIAEYPPLD
jgi:hypothetical protein